MKTEMKICKHKDCGKQYDQKEVVRIYGAESRPATLGYCSSQCYTKAATSLDDRLVKAAIGEIISYQEKITDLRNKQTEAAYNLMEKNEGIGQDFVDAMDKGTVDETLLLYYLQKLRKKTLDKEAV